MFTIAIDFDGTLSNTHDFPEIGEPRLWLINRLIAFRKSGGKLILWTCREDVSEGEYANFPAGTYLSDAVEWCRSYGLEFDAVNQNLEEVADPMIRTSRKILADIYIDDKSGIFIDEAQSVQRIRQEIGLVDVYF